MSIPDLTSLLEVILSCITDNGGFPINITVGTLIHVQQAVIRLANPKANVGQKSGFLDRGVLELDVGSVNMNIKLKPEILKKLIDRRRDGPKKWE